MVFCDDYFLLIEIQRVLSVLSVADANAETAHLSEEAESTTPRVVLERKIFIPVDKYPGVG